MWPCREKRSRMNFYLRKLIEMAVPSAAVVIIVTVVCVIAHFLFHKRLNMKRIVPYTLMAVYLFVLLVTAVFEREWNAFDEPQVNLMPLYDLQRDVVRPERAILMITLNTLVFIPWGVLLPVLYSPFRKFRWILAAGFGMSLAIEITQLLGKMGIFETDDLIFNTLGTILGFLVYKLCVILFQNKTSRMKEGKSI